MMAFGPDPAVARFHVSLMKGGGEMKTSVVLLAVLSAAWAIPLVQNPNASAQDGASTQPTRTIVGDLLDVDRDLYIVRGELGEIQIEATYTTEVTEEFAYGDRIKALVLMNNKALKIERAGPDDVPGVTAHDVAASPSSDQGQDQASSSGGESTTQDVAPSTAGQGDEPRVVEGQVLMVDGDFYVLRGERGEIRVERTAETRMTEDFRFGDFIKATVTPNDQALTIERLVP